MSYQPNPVPALCNDLIRKQAQITKTILENTWRNKLYDESADSFSTDKFDIPFKGLREGITTLRNMREQIDELYEFVNNTKSSAFQSAIGQVLEWRSLTDLTSVSVKYIEEGFAKKVAGDIERLLSGKEPYDGTLKRYSDVMSIENISRSFYSSDIPKYVKLKQLSGMNRVQDVVITPDLARLKLADWLLKVTCCYLDGSKNFSTFERSSLDAIVTSVKRGFEDLYDELKNQNAAALEAIRLNASSGVTANQVNTLYAHIFNVTFGIESRIVILLYRLIAANIANIRNLYEIYNRVTKCKNGLDIIQLEEYDEEDWGNEKNPSLTNNSLMRQAAKQAMGAIINSYSIDKIKFDIILSRTIGNFPNLADGETTMADSSFYIAVDKFMQILNSRVTNVHATCAIPGKERPFSDVLLQHKLQENPGKYIEWIRGTNEIPSYTSPVTDILLGELMMFQHSLLSESTRLESLVKTLSIMKSDIQSNVNGKYDWLEDEGVAIDWCAGMIDALGKVNVILGWKYRKRLTTVINLLPETSLYQGEKPVYDTGYFPLHPEDDVDAQTEYEEDCANEMLSELNRKYMNMYKKKLNGRLYFEETPTDDDNKETASTKPAVRDNAEQPSENKTESNTETGKPANGKEKESVGKKIVDRVRKKWQDFKDLIAKLSSDGIKAKNQKFLTDNRDFLISRNYTNTSIDILPYIDNTDYISMIRGCITKASAINDAVLKTADENGIRNAIFSDLKMPKTDNLQADIVHGLKVGTAELKVVTLSDNALKEKVPKMISFCEMYYSKFEDELNGLESEIKKLNIIDDKSASGDENDRTEKNKSLIGIYLSQAIVATRYASRDRCNDYINILAQLASSNKKNKESVQQDTDESKKA